MKKFISIFFILFCLVLSFNGVSAAPADISGAGVVSSELRQQAIDEQVERDIIDKDLMPFKEKKKPFNEKLKRTPVPDGVSEQTGDPFFVLTKVIFDGATIYEDDEFNEIFADLLGQKVHLHDMINLASIVTRKYHYDGYITSFAYLPQQDVLNGVVTIKVVESKVSKINVNGNKWTRPWFFHHAMFNPSRLTEGSVFNVDKMDSVIKQLNNINYVKAMAYISTEENIEETEINLDVKDRMPISFNVAWDDNGRDVVGLQRARMTLGYENVTGFGDSAYGGVVLATGTTGVLAGYKVPISPYGTKLAFDYGYTNVSLGNELKKFGIEGTSKMYSLKVLQPLLQTSKKDIGVSLSFDFSDTNSIATVAHQTLTDYALRVFRGNLWGIFDDNYGRSLFSFTASAGIRGMGASGTSLSGSKANFSKFNFDVIRLQKLPLKESYLIGRLGAQYSPDKLYPIEQMQLGGFNSIRGYEAGAVLGDYGVNGSIEARFPIPGLKKILPKRLKNEANRAKFLVFYDFGFTKTHGNTYDYSQSFFHSAGCGLNLLLPADITLNLGVGIPLGGSARYKQGSARFYFAFSTAVDRLLFYKFAKETL